MNDRERRNARLIRELLERVDRREAVDPDDYYAPGYVDHHPSPGRSLAEGREGIRRAFEMFFRAFPDTRHTIHHLFAHEDRVVAHISAVATHQGELMGIAPTGREVYLESIAIYRIDNDRIAERWCFQGKGIMEQLREAGAQQTAAHGAA